MKIGIDARLYGTEHTGLGRYVSKLIDNLPRYDKKNSYVIFIHPRHLFDIPIKPGKRFQIVPTEIPIYGFREQLLLPILYYKYNLDLLHVPHFNAPILYFKDKILTIHDLIKHGSVGKETTTRSKWLYTVKRLGYLFLTQVVIRQARAIIVPTNYVKDNILKRIKINPDKIFVTYEATSGSIKNLVLSKSQSHQILVKYSLNQPFLVYTGNVYPHKNVDILIDAVALHNQHKEVGLQLAIICARSVFWERLNRRIAERNLQNTVKLLGYLDDNEVSKIYSLALALVHPSKMEGFGLTGIEAMGVGLPVISSNASCLPEIYGEAALFFDPDDVNELVTRIEQIISDASLRRRLSEKGYLQVKKYSWDKMVKETIAIYNSTNAQ